MGGCTYFTRSVVGLSRTRSGLRRALRTPSHYFTAETARTRGMVIPLNRSTDGLVYICRGSKKSRVKCNFRSQVATSTLRIRTWRDHASLRSCVGRLRPQLSHVKGAGRFTYDSPQRLPQLCKIGPSSATFVNQPFFDGVKLY